MKKTSPQENASPILIGVIIEGNQDAGQLAKLFSEKGRELEEFAPLQKRDDKLPPFNNDSSGGIDRFTINPFYLEKYGYTNKVIENGVIKTAEIIRADDTLTSEFKVVSLTKTGEHTNNLKEIDYETAEDISATPATHARLSLV